MMDAATDDIEDFMSQLRGWAEGISRWTRAVREPVLLLQARESTLIDAYELLQAKQAHEALDQIGRNSARR